MTGIYKITNPNGKIYIGQSVNIEKRLASYRKSHCKDQSGIYNSIKKHGWQSHIFEVVMICDASMLNHWERHYQDYFNSVQEGLNCYTVGTSDKSGYHTSETKKKMSLAKRGKKQTESHKMKLSLIRKGKKQSEESNKKRSESLKLHYQKNGRHPNQNHTGRKRSEATKEIMRQNNARANSKMVIDKSTGVIYESATEAANAYCVGRTTISRRIKNQNNPLSFL